MGFKRSSDPRTTRVDVRMTPEERAQIAEQSSAAGMSVSEYMRRRSLGAPVRSIADQQTINELRRLGGLMKHTHNRSGGKYSEETAAALLAITEAIKRI